MRPSRARRRQLKRSQAEGGIIGALQKTIIGRPRYHREAHGNRREGEERQASPRPHSGAEAET